MTEKVLKSRRRGVEETGLKLSITEREKEGKSQVIASSNYLEEKFQECSKREGVGPATRSQEKERGGQKCDVRFLLIEFSRRTTCGFLR